LEAIHSIKASSKNLYLLLENLLNWSRLKIGRMEFEPEWFNVEELFNSLINIYKIAASNKEVKIVLEIEENVKMFADKNMTATVLRNLISNAIKFTYRKGTIIISVEKEQKRLLIKIVDTGMGMSEQQLKDVFDIENSFSTPGTENEEGTGLGLILCQELIIKNKGTLEVESVLGKGTTFTLHFNIL